MSRELKTRGKRSSDEHVSSALDLSMLRLGIAIFVEVYTTGYVLEGYISPMFLEPGSYRYVVLPVLVVNVDSPRYGRKAHRSLVTVLETHILLYTGSAVPSCSPCLRSFQGYARSNRCLYKLLHKRLSNQSWKTCIFRSRIQ